MRSSGFLGLSEEEKIIYQIGRRTGVMRDLNDLTDTVRRERAKTFIEENGVNASNIGLVVDELIKRYI